MNKRQKKKKDKRSYLVLTDEMYLIGMNQDELNKVFEEREQYRKKYGYRKKYNSNKRLRCYYITPSKRQTEGLKQIFDTCRLRKSVYYTSSQSMDNIDINHICS